MAVEFNFDKLTNIYKEALKSFDKTLIFENEVGKGRFLFMMFLSDEDKEAKDNLFIYLRNTKQFVKIKLYGNHLKGNFNVYIKDIIKRKLIDELLLKNQGNQVFNFYSFLDDLNSCIPLSIPIPTKLNSLRENNRIIQPLNVVDEKDKTILLGEKRLPKGQKPQDKTLRKLYIYTKSNESDITELITLLKKFNMTVRWTIPENNHKAKNIREIINKIDI